MAGQSLEMSGNNGHEIAASHHGAFRTVDYDGAQPRLAVVTALPEDKPAYLYQGIKDAGMVHLIGGEQADQARAITMGTLPDLAQGKTVWAVDLSGDRVTDDVAARAKDAGLGTYHWPDVSPTLLVQAHEIDRASLLVVDSMPQAQQSDPDVRLNRNTHVKHLFGALGDERPFLPHLYNAIGTALRSELQDSRFKLTDEQQARVKKLYATNEDRSEGRTVLSRIHGHVEDLLSDDEFQGPIRFNEEQREALFNYGVTDDGHPIRLDLRRRLLIVHMDTKLSRVTHPLRTPDKIVVAGTEHADPDRILHMQGVLERNGSRDILVFGKRFNDTTLAVMGTDHAVGGSLGGLTGTDAKKVSEVYGARWRAEETSVADHIGSSGGSEEKGLGYSNSMDVTTAWDNRPDVHESDIRVVKPGHVTLWQGSNVHRNVPIVPESTAARRAVDPNPRPRAIEPANGARPRPGLRGLLGLPWGRGGQ